MAMPEHHVLIRHGQSEANIIQQRFKADPAATLDVAASSGNGSPPGESG